MEKSASAMHNNRPNWRFFFLNDVQKKILIIIFSLVFFILSSFFIGNIYIYNISLNISSINMIIDLGFLLLLLFFTSILFHRIYYFFMFLNNTYSTKFLIKKSDAEYSINSFLVTKGFTLMNSRPRFPFLSILGISRVYGNKRGTITVFIGGHLGITSIYIKKNNYNDIKEINGIIEGMNNIMLRM